MNIVTQYMSILKCFNLRGLQQIKLLSYNTKYTKIKKMHVLKTAW